MKTSSPIVSVGGALVALWLCVGPAFGQGSLTPPGPPGPAMKTLDQVEPRTPIDTLPIFLTQSGSYYLTRSFAQGFGIVDAITIMADNVTVDFNGFTIQQTNIPAAMAGVRINASFGNTPVRNVVIRNGTIIGFGGGITSLGGQNCLIENMHMTRGGGGGVSFQALGTAGAARNTFRRCRMTENGGSGIVLISGAANIANTIESCESLNNLTGFAIAGAGNLIVGCRASGNTGNNYTIAPGNRGGVIVLSATNPAQINGSSGGAGTGTSDPFANLSF